MDFLWIVLPLFFIVTAIQNPEWALWAYPVIGICFYVNLNFFREKYQARPNPLIVPLWMPILFMPNVFGKFVWKHKWHELENGYNICQYGVTAKKSCKIYEKREDGTAKEIVFEAHLVDAVIEAKRMLEDKTLQGKSVRVCDGRCVVEFGPDSGTVPASQIFLFCRDKEYQ